ncbi:3D domain-containing protein [Bdellovibrio sp. NC01]|uniref:3D domain-containing protein n=1 Tax=Bdellovibrio sp. NC01 TaxID=2220073 RepID=UPI0011598A40|nr:3D domain-containing protein [Bdellovibrio sp. NC01]QDK36674.1 hypothetical protein DOE51_03190 [Bdellovibrio sp. NC01]
METQNCITKIVLMGSLFVSAHAFGAAGMCRSDIATTSVYFIPHIKDYCHSSTPCAAFKKQVRMQGSGTLSGNRILTYTGKTVSLGSCDTALGAGGDCLIPYISVAADPRYYSIGDIIKMPNLKGKVMTLPNGKTFVHPGYLIVHDTGGAIKGRNRFDLFTGSMDPESRTNSFGYSASEATQMIDGTDCSSNKQFTVIRRNSAPYQNSLVAIEDATRNTSGGRMMIASSEAGSEGVQ